MSNDEVTQPLPPRPFPRYVIKTYAEEAGIVFVYDTWAGCTVREFRGRPGNPGTDSADPQASAEAVAANLNSTTALEFVQTLSWHIVSMCYRVGEGELAPGDIVEDMIVLLKHYENQLRGIKTEPLDQTALHMQAPWINQ